jgi:hypothetical protein
VLRGDESEFDLKALGRDVFAYFGHGCRNVSKLFLPTGFDIKKIMKAWEEFGDLRACFHLFKSVYLFRVRF